MLKNFRVGTKIMIGFGAVICILLLISFVSYSGLESANKGFAEYHDISLVSNFVGHLEASLLRARIRVRDFIITGSDTDLKACEEAFQTLAGIYRQGETGVRDPRRQEKLKRINTSLDAYNNAFNDIAALTKSRDDIWKNRLDPIGQKMSLAIVSIMDSAHLNRDLETVYYAGSINIHLLHGQLYADRYLNTLDEAAITRVNAEFGKTMDADVAGLEKVLTDPGAKATLKVFLETKTTYLAAFEDLIRIIRQRGEAVENRLYKNGRIISDAAEDIRVSAVKDEEALGLEVSSSNAKTTFFLIVFSISSLIIAVFLALLISRQITGPVNQALEAVTRIAAGDLSGEFHAQKSNDEIGQLIGAMNQMVINLKKQAGGLAEAVNVLSASASEIVTTTAELAANASETAVSANETTTTVEEVRQTSNVSSQKSKYVSESAQKAAQIAKAGKKAVEENMAGMSGIKQKMESVAESIVTLSEQSQAIGEIIAAVDDLAEQTNLLAVNASIEAAKAGEQGKGFSVVAQEIKALAEQSKLATRRVRAILNDIQKATGKAVMATEESSKTVDAGTRLSIQSGETIQTLADAITEAAQAATQISASIQQQLAGMDQVAVAMENVKTASVQNAEGAKQMEIATHNISELGSKLKELVSWYRISV